MQGIKAHHFQACAAESKTTRNPRKNRTAAAKSRTLPICAARVNPFPSLGSGCLIQLLGAGPHPVFISLGALIQSMNVPPPQKASPNKQQNGLNARNATKIFPELCFIHSGRRPAGGRLIQNHTFSAVCKAMWGTCTPK